MRALGRQDPWPAHIPPVCSPRAEAGLPDLGSCRKILVVKLDFVGDWVLTLPFLAALRRRAPRAEITAVVLERVFALAARCRLVDRVLAVTGPDASAAVGRSAAETAGFLHDYRSAAFDLALVPRWDVDFNGASALAAASGAPAVVGFAEACTRRRRRINRGFDRFFTHALDDRVLRHEAEQNLRLLDLFGSRTAVPPPRLDTGAEDEARAAAFLADAFPGDERPVLALAPFASEAKRMLPLPRTARLARWLAATFPVNLAIVGGAEHARRAGRLAALCPGRAASACGHLDLPASAALLRHAAAFVGMDSGPAHIAAALGTPVAVLSCHPADGRPGHENAPQRFAPWGDAERILVLQPPAAVAPCAGACRASTAHCIAALPEAMLERELEPFILRALPERAPLPLRRAAGGRATG